MTTKDNYAGPMTKQAGNDSPRIPSCLVPLLTTWCLTTAAVLQGLAVAVPTFSALLPIGTLLSVIGLGAYACVRSGRIHNGWAFLGLVPVLGLLISYTVLRFRDTVPDAPLNAARGAAHATLLGLILFGSVASMMTITQRGREIRGETPDYFPVLLVVAANDSSYTAHVVPKRNLDEFTREHPDYSYLVPKHLEASLHENLENGSEYMFQSPTFEVSEISSNRQRFKVRYPIHDEAWSIGWYEATAKEIEPDRFLQFHEMMFGLFVWPALFFGGAIYSAFNWLLNRILWPRFGLSRGDEEVTD